MLVRPLEIPEVRVIELKVFADDRGWMSESYREADWLDITHPHRFVQDNHSFSVSPFTLRGIHFQRAPFAQAKLVQVLQGEIFDVAVDLRRGSPTFRRWISQSLKGGDGKQFYVPVGFGHAFLTLTPNTLVQYKVTAPYKPEAEGGLLWNDPGIAIEWPAMAAPPILSPRDRSWSPLSDATELF